MHFGQSVSRLVAAFRKFYARRLDDPSINEMVDKLGRESAEFKGIWEQHEVQCAHEEPYRFLHPAAGEMKLLSNAFYDAERQDVTLVVYTPASTVDGERLKRLHQNVL